MARCVLSKLELLLFVIAWILALSVVCLGTEPAKLIDAPAQVSPYRFVDAKVAGEWESAIWSIEPESGVDQRTSADGRTLTFVAPPGTYDVRAVCVNFSTKRIAQGKATITIGEATPAPKPTPDPTPKPSPTKPVSVYLIYESGDLSPAQARVRDGQAWKKSAEAAGIKWLAFDVDQGKKKFPQATQRAVSCGLPAVVFLDSQGVPDVAKAPATPEALDSLVKAKAGK